MVSTVEPASVEMVLASPSAVSCWPLAPATRCSPEWSFKNTVARARQTVESSTARSAALAAILPILLRLITKGSTLADPPSG